MDVAWRWVLFLIIIIVYIQACTHKHQLLLLVWTCVTWDWITYQGLMPREEKVTLFQRPLLACRSSSGSGSFWNFSRHVFMSAGVVICRIYLDAIYIIDISRDQFPVISRKYYYVADVLILWLLQFFSPPFCHVPWVWGVGVALQFY